MTNIPIYRAKKINSDEYAVGHYLPTYKTERNECGDNIDEDEVLHHCLIKSISNAETDDEDNFHFWGFEEIDPSTLAIHFHDMLDSQGNKIFASLSEDGKGGDIFKHSVNCRLDPPRPHNGRYWVHCESPPVEISVAE